jgi:hypothetical protein
MLPLRYPETCAWCFSVDIICVYMQYHLISYHVDGNGSLAVAAWEAWRRTASTDSVAAIIAGTVPWTKMGVRYAFFALAREPYATDGPEIMGRGNLVIIIRKLETCKFATFENFENQSAIYCPLNALGTSAISDGDHLLPN